MAASQVHTQKFLFEVGGADPGAIYIYIVKFMFDFITCVINSCHKCGYNITLCASAFTHLQI